MLDVTNRRLTRRVRQLLPGKAAYADKVLGLSPIAYWPLWDTSLPTAVDISGNGLDGEYKNTFILGEPGIGDGNTSAYFDGQASGGSVVDLYSAALNSLFDPDQGTVSLWCRSTLAAWTDGQDHMFYIWLSSGLEYVSYNRYAGSPNRVSIKYKPRDSGAGERDITIGPSTDWFHIAVTWDNVSSNVCIVYYNTDPVTICDPGSLGANLDSTRTIIGASTNGGLSSWEGWLAHATVFDYPLTSAQISVLYTV